MLDRFLFTSESVTEGHPDKMADQISDAVLDAILDEDPTARVACETLLTTGMVCLAGEITTKAKPDFQKIVRDTVEKIGYTDATYGFDSHTCAVLTAIGRQSPNIGQGVDTGGAGDQGMMFGYATDETDELMPMPIMFAHKLTKALADYRRSSKQGSDWIRPDGKSQVSIRYEKNKPVAVETVVISTQHARGLDQKKLRDAIIAEVIEPNLPEGTDRSKVVNHVNPTGLFEIGGPQGDAGLTGRKIIVDTYGGWGRHGGGAFSGKDPSKVDRSACYAARWVAKNIVAAGLATRCEVQLAYAIGVAQPVSVMVDTFGTNTVPEKAIDDAVQEVFDLTPGGIIKALDLRKPIYGATASYGHFGREAKCVDTKQGKSVLFSWERTDRVEELRDAVN